eukprot:Hpha_TRINITY_DN16214_c1_g4::TRINITY_DN16214_c1_g4_i1::g.16086::m.16086
MPPKHAGRVGQRARRRRRDEDDDESSEESSREESEDCKGTQLQMKRDSHLESFDEVTPGEAAQCPLCNKVFKTKRKGVPALLLLQSHVQFCLEGKSPDDEKPAPKRQRREGGKPAAPPAAPRAAKGSSKPAPKTAPAGGSSNAPVTPPAAAGTQDETQDETQEEEEEPAGDQLECTVNGATGVLQGKSVKVTVDRTEGLSGLRNAVASGFAVEEATLRLIHNGSELRELPAQSKVTVYAISRQRAAAAAPAPAPAPAAAPAPSPARQSPQRSPPRGAQSPAAAPTAAQATREGKKPAWGASSAAAEAVRAPAVQIDSTADFPSLGGGPAHSAPATWALPAPTVGIRTGDAPRPIPRGDHSPPPPKEKAGPTQQREDCATCDGRGRTRTGKKCDRCGGTGEVTFVADVRVRGETTIADFFGSSKRGKKKVTDKPGGGQQVAAPRQPRPQHQDPAKPAEDFPTLGGAPPRQAAQGVWGKAASKGQPQPAAPAARAPAQEPPAPAPAPAPEPKKAKPPVASSAADFPSLGGGGGGAGRQVKGAWGRK